MKIPVNLNPFLRLNDLSVSEKPDAPSIGSHDKDTNVIFINPNDDSKQKRLALAAQIGTILCEREYAKRPADKRLVDTNSDLFEIMTRRSVNNFIRNSLAPIDMIETISKELLADPDGVLPTDISNERLDELITQLSDRFDAPESIIRFQLIHTKFITTNKT